MAVPMLVLENIQVVRIAVACEHQERPTVANMLWGTCPREVLGFSVARGQTSKFPPGDERRGFLDGVVPLVENHPSMFRVAIEVEIGGMEAPIAIRNGNRCSRRHGLIPLRLNAFRSENLDQVTGHCQHERTTVVPIDLDLRPAVMRMNRNNGSKRTGRNRVGIVRHEYQSDPISDLGYVRHHEVSFRLENLSKQAVSHRIECFAGVEVFGKKRAGGLWLLRVGDLKRVGQSSETLNRFVVGLADLLSLVCVHRTEGVAKNLFIGVLVGSGHGRVPCGWCQGWWLLLVLEEVLQHLLLFVELVEFRFRFLGLAKVAIGEVRPAQAAGLVVEHRGRIFYGSLGSPEHLFGGLCDPFLGVRNHPLEAVELFLDRCDRWVCGGVVHRRFSMFVLGFSFGVTTQFPCSGKNIKPMWKVMFWILEECFRAPQTPPFGTGRVALDLGRMTPSNGNTPTHRNRGAFARNQPGLAPEPIPNGLELVPAQTGDRIVLAVMPAGDQSVAPALDILDGRIQRRVVFGLDLVRMVGIGVNSLAFGKVGHQMDLSDVHVSAPWSWWSGRDWVKVDLALRQSRAGSRQVGLHRCKSPRPIHRPHRVAARPYASRLRLGSSDRNSLGHLGGCCCGYESAPIGFYESRCLALGELAKDRAVERRVGRLSTGARPVTLRSHRFDHLLDAQGLGRFAQNLVGGSQRAQALGLVAVGFLCDPLEFGDRFGRTVDGDHGGWFVLDHGKVVGRRDLRRTLAFADFALQPLGALDVDLLARRKVRSAPTTTGFLAIDLDLDLLAGDVRIVLSTDLDLCLFHLHFSNLVAMVGCHHQAAGTSRRDASTRADRVSALVRDVPSSLRAVSKLPPFYDVDDLVRIDVIVVFVILLVVDLLPRCQTNDPVFERPVLLGHHPHFTLAPQLIAVLFEACNQFVNGHICSPLCFWLVGVGQVGEAGGEEIHNRAGQIGLCVEVESAIPIEDHLLDFESLQPEFRNLALAQFVLFAFGVFGEDQGVEAVPGNRSANPGSATRGTSCGLGDLQVVAQVKFEGFVCLGHRWFSVFGVVGNSFSLTHMSHAVETSSSGSGGIWEVISEILLPPNKPAKTCDLRCSRQIGLCGHMRKNGPLLRTYPESCDCDDRGRNDSHITRKPQGKNLGAKLSWNSSGLVVFASQVEQFVFDPLPIAVGLASDFAEGFIAKLSLVPTFGPTQPVEESVEFRFAKASPRSIPATLGSVFLGVVPIGASLGVHRELCQPQDHHQVSDHLGLVERSGEGPEFDSVLARSQVREVQQVVAIRFASVLRGIFVAVLFDPFGVDRLFSPACSGAGEDRFLVVADQGNQSGQGSCVAIPFDRYVQSTARVDLRVVLVDLVDRVFDLFEAFVSLELGAYEFAPLAVGCFWFDARVAFCSPAGWEPRYLVSVVVGSDGCGVAVWQGGLEFDSEGDLVCVHLCLSVWVGWVCRLRSRLRSRVTHEALRFGTHPAEKACFPQSFRMFFGRPTNATVGPVWGAKTMCPRGRTRKEIATLGHVLATVRNIQEGSLA